MYRHTVAFLLLLLLVVATVTVAEPRIVGGQNAHRGQFPYQVQLDYNGTFTCGGSVIASRWILTAAHCVDDDPDPTKYTVIAGALRVTDDGHRYQVDRVVQHEAFSESDMINDVAVLRLSGNIAFNENVKAIRFEGPVVGGHQPAVVTGWGRTGWSEPIAKELQFLNTTTITNAECQKRVNNIDSTWNIYNSSICTFWGSAGHGNCMGDSGGPMVVNGVLAGLVSWSIRCAVGYPDVYTRVSCYVHWINDKMGENTN